MTERELTARVRLVGRDGRLNPDAVGWARRPLVDTSGIDGRRSFGRNKRWEYWNVTTPTHILALTVSSLDYAAVHEVWVLDRSTGRHWGRSATVLPARDVRLPAALGYGPARARARGLAIAIDDVVGGGTRLRARIDATGDDGPPTPLSFDVHVTRPPGHECLAVVVPWSARRFQYTVKDVALPAAGTLTIGGVDHAVPADESWAVLDHGRGRWPHDVRWNWGAGSGRSDGRTIGVQVGGQWTDGTGSTENGVLIDGRLHKISDELVWEYDPADVLAPWRIHGGPLDLVFEPFHDKVTRTNLGVLSGSTDQCFGHYRGTFTTADGQHVAFGGILGWAEDVHNRW